MVKLVLLIHWLLLLDLLDAFAVVKHSPFLQTVTSWLDEEDIFWHQQDDILFPTTITSTQPILEVTSYNKCCYYLHILQSPKSVNECISATCARDMTNYIQFMNTKHSDDENYTKISLIHLHEDVWNTKTNIVQSRLRIRLLGPTRESRIYARKTKVRRIDSGTAIPFLQTNHMWSATKARYYYGLYDSEDILVAVATFSNKRKIQIGNVKSRSVELLRFCTSANDTVVGGISKLTKAFINDHNQPDSPIDYLITVVDRDWGPGDGWHSIGFSTLHIMSPLLMLVKDGRRHHLVGAGVSNKKDTKTQLDRLGVEKLVLEELKSITNHKEALRCLEESMYYPVYDAGVERLIMTVPKSKTFETSSIIPSYGASYSSNNTGISALLANVVSQSASSIYSGPVSVPKVFDKTEVKDSQTAQHHINDWRAAPKDTTLLYETTSSMDPEATVKIRHRLGGWCTLGIVGGRTKSIRHGNFKMNDQQEIDSTVLVSEYIRSMASVALVAMEFQRSHPNKVDITNDKTNGISCLHLGFGSGSLPRFIKRILPRSKQVVVEIDCGIIRAAHDCNLLNVSSSSGTSHVELISGDALAYQRPNTDDPYDLVFIDIFDEYNILPSEFYTKEYIEKIQQNYLGGRSGGIVVHNFHTGGKKREKILQEALKSYRRVFSTVFVVESIDSFPTGGNAILVAMNQRRLDAPSETLSWYAAGRKTKEYFELDFDIAARSNHKLWLS